MKAKYIGERITELRLKMKVSEYQMSYDLGHNKNYIRDYFGLTPSEFFDTDYWNDMSEDI